MQLRARMHSTKKKKLRRTHLRKMLLLIQNLTESDNLKSMHNRMKQSFLTLYVEFSQNRLINTLFFLETIAFFCIMQRY